MKRKCDRCDNEATVHEVTIRAGRKVEKHLCEACAREDGIPVQKHVQIHDLITNFVLSQAAQPGAPKPGACPECGLTFAAFRQQGLLGCPRCYQAFEPQLSPLLERAHEGGSHHAGKIPKRAGAGSPDRTAKITTLRKQLSDAIAAEEYERAASLRDELLSAERAPAPPAERTGDAGAPRSPAP